MGIKDETQSSVRIEPRETEKAGDELTKERLRTIESDLADDAEERVRRRERSEGGTEGGRRNYKESVGILKGRREEGRKEGGRGRKIFKHDLGKR